MFCAKVSWSDLYFLTDIGALPNLFPNPRFIVIRRKDVLGQAISRHIAEHTQSWRKLHSEDEALPEIVCDVEAITRYMNGILQSNAAFCRYFAYLELPFHEVIYEDLCRDFRSEIGKVLDYIALDRPAPASLSDIPLKKQRTELNRRLRYEFLAATRRTTHLFEK